MTESNAIDMMNDSEDDDAGKKSCCKTIGELRCGVCGEIHPVKLDRNGTEFSTLTCIGSGSNVFARTPYGQRIFHEWKKAMIDDNNGNASHVRRSGDGAVLNGKRVDILGKYLSIRKKRAK